MMIELKSAYENQKRMSKFRGIEWLFTFESWIKWWNDSGYLHMRGNTKEKPYKMCRIGDTGPYSPDNVYCGTNADNIQDQYTYGGRVGWSLSSDQRLEASSKGGKACYLKHGDLNKLTQDEVSRRLDLIKNVDLTRYGWVSKVSKLIGVSHTQARRFVDHYYDGSVYKR
jgi:hypothetical protein